MPDEERERERGDKENDGERECVCERARAPVPTSVKSLEKNTLSAIKKKGKRKFGDSSEGSSLRKRR